MFDYQNISNDLIGNLSERSRDIISRRFGLGSVFRERDQAESVGTRESLEAIGKRYSITRERVRQIENEGIKKLGKRLLKYENVYSTFREKMDSFGGFKKEDEYLLSLGEKRHQNQIFFLLTLHNSFLRFTESKELHSFWTTEKHYYELAPRYMESFLSTLEKEKRPLSPEGSSAIFPEAISQNLSNYIEVSKKVHWNHEGFFGLKDWPEIRPKGIKDRAYLALKKKGHPLHFSEIAKLLHDSALVQTVHNEVIKDQRFVLVGRGMYALKEWGYKPGEVKDVIMEVIAKAGGALSRDEIVKSALKKRVVKRNTILRCLGNKKYFSRTADGKYAISDNISKKTL